MQADPELRIISQQVALGLGANAFPCWQGSQEIC